ncbi:MAG: LbtU family siderophore porin [Desulfobulbus sp.]|nr:LbtU family siderophore porin [Pseudomonadota bacterium]NLX18788.1 LbtU family siderophore porin [Desulfobulbus sp.]
MNGKLTRNLTLAAGMMCLVAQPAQAATDSREEIELLKQQVQQLMQQNQQLHQRLSEMEKNTAVQTIAGKESVTEDVALHEDEKSSGLAINEFVSLSGSIEGDFKTGEDFTGNHSSEFVLDTVELIMEARMTDWATGKIVIDYDGTSDSEDLFLDEAHITLGKTETFPFFLTGGKIYAPFGDFSTNMIQDPLTQALGEINPKGIIAGYEKNGVIANVLTYNGMREGGDPAEEENDSINGFGASLAYSYEQDECGFNAGIGWVSNLADAGTITDYLEEKGIFAVADQAPGLSLNLGARYNAFALLTEYVTALDHFTLDELPYGVSEAEPSAWNSELAYTATIMDKETVFAVGYQKSWEASALELPEHRYLVAASIGLFEGTTLAFEYYYDKDYSISDGGTDNNGNGFTTRLGYEF